MYCYIVIIADSHYGPFETRLEADEFGQKESLRWDSGTKYMVKNLYKP